MKILIDELLQQFCWDGGRWAHCYRQNMTDFVIFGQCVFGKFITYIFYIKLILHFLLIKAAWESPTFTYEDYSREMRLIIKRSHNRLHKRRSRLRRQGLKMDEKLQVMLKNSSN